MDEDITVINEQTRNEKIKNFFVNNKKFLISSLIILILIIVSFYSYKIYKNASREKISEKYNSEIIDYKNGENLNVLSAMKEIIEDKDTTYSPLALFFLIENDLIDNKEETNRLFDILIDKTRLEKEIKYLIIYKKALFNADFVNENQLLKIVNPIINSESIWKSHVLYLVAEYFYSKNEKQKSKEFFTKILDVKNANQDIIKKTQKRLKRDLSD